MPLNKELINNFIAVTSKAAISCYDFIGKNDKNNADKAATDSMRNEINKLVKENLMKHQCYLLVKSWEQVEI